MRSPICHLLFAATFLGCTFLPGYSQQIDNPVLPGVCDAGVLKYNGRYYIGGVATYGSFYYSDNLTDWKGPEHVFSMDNDWTEGRSAEDSQIHANDIHYINGKFHMFWSVNYWGRERHAVHIAHAVSDKVLGPYREPVRETWLDNRIDPMLFRDDDGSLYLYGVRFTDGNTIWARPMSDPANFSGDPIFQFHSLPATWERMDNRVAEGPWVFKYRSRYYMIYNANHTGTDWGNYQLGVAEADSPTTFNHGGKYPYPVMGSNQAELEDKHRDLLRFGDTYTPDFAYTEQQPNGNWTAVAFDDSLWKRGRGGFGTRTIEGSSVRPVGTHWHGKELRLRKTFRLANPKQAGNIALRILHDAPATVWLNGMKIYEGIQRDYRLVNLENRLLQAGDNVLAVESSRGERDAWLDCALFDMGDQHAGDILYSPGQPNILRGPNGIEWWLIYMANKNDEGRGQYINRVHFAGHRLYVEPISSSLSREYVSQPSAPTLSERFDTGATTLSESWKTQRDALWRIGAGSLTASGHGEVLLGEHLAASSYYFETLLRTDGQAGIILDRRSNGDGVIVEIDAKKRCWRLLRIQQEKQQREEFALPADFDYNASHTLSVRRNADIATLSIDELPAPGLPQIRLADGAKAVPGLSIATGTADFGTVTYTIGWDEYGSEITGWETLSGKFRTTEKGIESDASMAAVKGTPSQSYDFSLQITCPESGKSGVYPLYIDAKNYIRAEFDAQQESVLLTTCRKGKIVSELQIAPANLRPLFTDMKFSDSFEKCYTLEPNTRLDRILLPKEIAWSPGHYVEDLFARLSVEYRKNGRWTRIHADQMKMIADTKYEIAQFDPITADALRFTNLRGDDGNTYIYRILVHERFKPTWHLRAVRKNDQMILLLDGQEVARSGCAGMAPSQVGIFSDTTGARFDGIVCYDIPVSEN